jgi:acetate kinase
VATRVSRGRVLVLNAGSATLKATVLDRPAAEPLFDRTIDWTGQPGDDLDGMLDAIVEAGATLDSIDVVGHRVVHGGEAFTGPTLVDDEVLVALDAIGELAPLHNPVAIATIRAARERLIDAPHVADFDTAFHATLPVVARRYPIPDDWVADHGIRRFGFHGLSVEWSTRRAAELLGRPAAGLRLVVAHLGGGCSVTAVDGGRSVDTSMGLTPMEGLMMATRAGSIDPGIVFRLLRAGVAADEVERRLERESGLLGVGGTADMRRLLELAGDADERASLAIDLFVRRATAGIAATATPLPNLDAVVFTGGIGEHAATVRARICEGLGLLGVPAVGAQDVEGDAVLGRGSRGTAVLTVHAREDLVIADRALAAIAPGSPGR